MPRKPKIDNQTLYERLPVTFSVDEVKRIAQVQGRQAYRRIDQLLDNRWIAELPDGEYRKIKMQAVKKAPMDDLDGLQQSAEKFEESEIPFPAVLKGVIDPEEWHSMIIELQKAKIIKRRQIDLLIAYYAHRDIFYQAWDEVKKDGVTADETEHGRDKKRNPAWLVMKQASEMCKSLQAEMGLTPVAEMKLNLPDPDLESDPLAKLL